MPIQDPEPDLYVQSMNPVEMKCQRGATHKKHTNLPEEDQKRRCPLKILIFSLICGPDLPSSAPMCQYQPAPRTQRLTAYSTQHSIHT